jgi:hypothetical protein
VSAVTLRPVIDVRNVTDLAVPVATDLPDDLRAALAGRGDKDALPVDFDKLPTTTKADFLDVYVVAKWKKIGDGQTFFDYVTGFVESPFNACVKPNVRLLLTWGRIRAQRTTGESETVLNFVLESPTRAEFTLLWKGKDERGLTPVQPVSSRLRVRNTAKPRCTHSVSVLH